MNKQYEFKLYTRLIFKFFNSPLEYFNLEDFLMKFLFLIG